ncbi:hypothetical protein DFH11DRAFT_1152558 [Phellopilus nigrolimitatus]|nr:hypothetical protein DFH11DRAFT_1152558 [Phellopilus nigrolimitatus]
MKRGRDLEVSRAGEQAGTPSAGNISPNVRKLYVCRRSAPPPSASLSVLAALPFRKQHFLCIFYCCFFFSLFGRKRANLPVRSTPHPVASEAGRARRGGGICLSRRRTCRQREAEAEAEAEAQAQLGRIEEGDFPSGAQSAAANPQRAHIDRARRSSPSTGDDPAKLCLVQTGGPITTPIVDVLPLVKVCVCAPQPRTRPRSHGPCPCPCGPLSFYCLRSPRLLWHSLANLPGRRRHSKPVRSTKSRAREPALSAVSIRRQARNLPSQTPRAHPPGSGSVGFHMHARTHARERKASAASCSLPTTGRACVRAALGGR